MPKPSSPDLKDLALIRPQIWLWSTDIKWNTKIGRMFLRSKDMGISNSKELALFEQDWRIRLKTIEEDRIPVPAGYPVVQLWLPASGLFPDWFSVTSYNFCSAKLRATLNQQENVIQFLPIEIVSGSDQIRAQDYRLMRILAVQPTMDITRSACDVEERFSRITGQTYKSVSMVDHYVLHEGFTPRTEIFRMAERQTRIVATEGLAARVQEARCTGMEFRHPDDTNLWGMHVDHLRSVEGITKRRFGF